VIVIVYIEYLKRRVLPDLQIKTEIQKTKNPTTRRKIKKPKTKKIPTTKKKKILTN